MNLSLLNRSLAGPTWQLRPLLVCGLVLGLCTACNKPVASTPTTTTSNTSEAATVNNDPAAAKDEPAFAPARAGKVLRHAVFFSFKEESSEEEMQRVVDAFRELPSKIEEIIDFQWGINNSPEGLNDGFTHCFLLTFKDEAGRAAYLPHDAHKAFGDVLRPHKDKVFVVDYWGTPSDATLEKELKHAVFFRFKEDAAPEEITKVEEAFAALPSKIDTIKDFEWGTNNSPENHAAGFTHCFMVTFDTEEGRAAYLPHPDHEAFVEILKPVLDAPRVLDFWAQE
ncbi:MAG TPA: Dabb family protein [Pirellulaceae bacterium]|nr:Dabb family protein [Pirellulaceae bacterium]